MRFFKLQSERYYPGELISHLYMMMGMHLLIGTQEFLDLIRFMIKDIENYPKFDGKKILWIHLLPFYQETLQSYFNSNRKYQIIASDIIIDSMEEMDETKPFHALAKKIIRNLYNGSYSHKAEMVGTPRGCAPPGRGHPVLPLGLQAVLGRQSSAQGETAGEGDPDADPGWRRHR